MANRFFKDPQAEKDATWDWTEWLGDGETITAATVTASGVTSGPVIVTSPLVVCRISGGTAGATGAATCRITSSAGQIDDRTMYFVIREQ